MKITIGVLLHKNSASSKEESVRQDMEGVRNIRNCKDGESGKDSIESIKRSLMKWCPNPSDILVSEGCERSDNVGVIGDEFAIEIGEAKEQANAFD